MYIRNFKTGLVFLFCFFFSTMLSGCKKLIEINEPINTTTTAKVFSSDGTAISAMAGIYTMMINGASTSDGGISVEAFGQFSNGLITLLGSLSSDDLYEPAGVNGAGYYFYNSNHLTRLNSGPSNNIWGTAYTTIYKANSVIEGIAASTAPALHDNIRNELTGEAKFVRAFCYFYLTNCFGDVPMALTVDFNKTQNLPRMPQAQVYQQIIQDLKDAQAALAANYSRGNDERVIPNKWAATLMLARAYLYTKDYPNAAEQASAIINNISLYGLEDDLNKVFLKNSREAIWQLKQTATDGSLKNATPEGLGMLPVPLSNGIAHYCLTNQLLAAFEQNDQRREIWVGKTDNSYNTDGSPHPPFITYFPFKYIIGSDNGDLSQPPPQYYMVLRVAEAYLIRAEAEANGAAGGIPAAIADLNRIRKRAGLPNLDSNPDMKSAVAKERQTEFFAEWGHRWFDLKRTGRAHDVLSVIPLKQPWAGDYQLIYPIPVTEITADHFLTQNQGY